MIYVESMVKIADNSGGKSAKCIKVLNKSSKGFGGMGSLVVLSIRKVKPKIQMKKRKLNVGDVVVGIIIRTKKAQKTNLGRLSFSENAVVLIKKEIDVFLGSRVFGAVSSDLRYLGYNRLVSLSKTVI